MCRRIAYVVFFMSAFVPPTESAYTAKVHGGPSVGYAVSSRDHEKVS